LIYGYTRPFGDKELNDLQIQKLNQLEKIEILQENHSHAKNRDVLDLLLTKLNTGDELYVYSFYALADSTRQLLELLHVFQEREIIVHFIANNVNTSSTSSYTFLEIIEKLVHFQSEMISEKTKIGLIEAQKKGNSAGRPKKSMSSITKAIEMYHAKKSLDEIKEATGISKSTLYRNLEN